MRDVATTRSGHMRDMLNLVEDLQAALSEVHRLRHLQRAPETRRLLGDRDIEQLVAEKMEALRAGLDRLRAEL